MEKQQVILTKHIDNAHMKHTSWNKFHLIFQTKFPIKYSIKILLNSDYSQKKTSKKKKIQHIFRGRAGFGCMIFSF